MSYGARMICCECGAKVDVSLERLAEHQDGTATYYDPEDIRIVVGRNRGTGDTFTCMECLEGATDVRED